MEYGFAEILRLIGALGVFLFGMKVMSDALLKLAGNRMRSFLASMTSNRVFGIFTGFLITSVIQSSSATTLMVVSFSNAGLLTLTEAISVIM
ncbi:MAG: Na/Pi symporter, partial [Flavobacteriaceae bacterium]|nr:Na/Pi symporter [Flavobacteriaceae bacterium]